jgi:hypothetical protein
MDRKIENRTFLIFSTCVIFRKFALLMEPVPHGMGPVPTGGGLSPAARGPVPNRARVCPQPRGGLSPAARGPVPSRVGACPQPRGGLSPAARGSVPSRARVCPQPRGSLSPAARGPVPSRAGACPHEMPRRDSANDVLSCAGGASRPFAPWGQTPPGDHSRCVFEKTCAGGCLR